MDKNIALDFITHTPIIALMVMASFCLHSAFASGLVSALIVGWKVNGQKQNSSATSL
jgi:hypothetical protein